MRLRCSDWCLELWKGVCSRFNGCGMLLVLRSSENLQERYLRYPGRVSDGEKVDNSCGVVGLKKRRREGKFEKFWQSI